MSALPRVVLGLVISSFVAVAAAQQYPTHSVNMIVPYAAAFSISITAISSSGTGATPFFTSAAELFDVAFLGSVHAVQKMTDKDNRTRSIFFI